MMPKSKRVEFNQNGFDAEQWQQHFRRHQQDYIRKRLRAVKLFAENKDVPAIAQELSINKNQIYSFINTYLSEGFTGVCRKTTRRHKTRLSKEQEQVFKQTIITKAPFECEFEGNLWNSHLMRQFIKREFAVEFSSGIYDLLKRLNLSHQKAHSDYQNADQNAQIEFIEDFKQVLLDSDQKTAVVSFDEFSISTKPSNYYGWAEKNTRPKVKTDEKKERARTDC